MAGLPRQAQDSLGAQVPHPSRLGRPAEYAALEKLAGRAITLRQALFTVPWYMATVDTETAARTLSEAPLPLKVVYKLTRRSYGRLVETAFGSRS